jgi:hypothetical protein
LLGRNKARTLSTRTLREVRSVLKRAITRAQARDKVKRNVVLLCDIPQGRTGRPSKSLTLAQAEALLAAAENTSLHAYIVVSLFTGAEPRNYDRSPGPTSISTATRRSSWSGGPSVQVVTLKPRSPAGP